MKLTEEVQDFMFCHKNSEHIVKKNKISSIIKYEERFKLDKKKTMSIFLKNLNINKKLNYKLKKIKMNGKTIHGYGASTKGNVCFNSLTLIKIY